MKLTGLWMAVLVLSVSQIHADGLPKDWVEKFSWRSVGPAAMGGRITALAVNPNDPCMWWAATASGGLLKTVNNGVSFEHQFDHASVVSIGDVQVSPSNPDILWIGTGESNPRNSVSWGNGVYKSLDGGKSWSHMGLDHSFQIGRIAIHPTNPDVVYVGALGRLWGSNDERGLFRTRDAGKTWEKVLYIDDNTGVVEVQMHPAEPDTLLVATYERRRDGFDTNDPAVRFGAGTALYKTTDGGDNFRKISEGLPTVKLGRIGIDFCASNPDIVYMLVESEKIGLERENAPYLGIRGEDATIGARLTDVVDGSPAKEAGLKIGDIVIALNDKTLHTFADFTRAIAEHDAGDLVPLEVSRDKRSVFLEVAFGELPKPEEGEGGSGRRARRSRFAGSLGGQRENLHTQQGGEGFEFGGLFRSEDSGDSWTRVNSLNPRPMYFSQVRVDPIDDQRVYVLGVSLYRSSDGGKNFTGDGGRGVHVDHHALWIDPKDGRHMILGNDGGLYVTYDRMGGWDHLNHVAIGQFYDVGVSADRDYSIYGGLQDNGTWGGPSRATNGGGPIHQDWRRVGGGDGFVCVVDPNDPGLVYFESQNGGVGRRHLVTGDRASIRPRAPRGTRYRFNWKTPFILSHHNSKIYYVAGSRVFRSLDRGNGMKTISEEITLTDRGSATALSESPRDSDVLYVGSDDGAVWMTRNGGVEWTPLYRKVEEPNSETITLVSYQPPRGDSEQPRRRGRMRQRMMELDANEDGKIQRSEVPEEMLRFFERIDANSDGVVDEKEMQAAANRRGRRGGRAQGEQQPPQSAPDGNADAAPATGSPEAEPEGKGQTLNDLLPGPRWVSSLQASAYETGRCYVTFDGHRSDDDTPYILVTEDFGKSWTSLRGDLPVSAGSAKVVQEDRVNPNLLYLGTEFGAWVSIDRGAHWTRLKGRFPTVAVHDFAQHAQSGDVVVGTHGRSIWILDATPLREMTAKVVAKDAHLYSPLTAIIWRNDLARGDTNRRFVGENPARGARIYYSFAKDMENAKLEVFDGTRLIREFELEKGAGLHSLAWDLRQSPRATQGQRRQRRGRLVSTGKYDVVLSVDGTEQAQSLQVRTDPNYADSTWLEFQELEEQGLFDQGDELESESDGEKGHDSSDWDY